jgi:hypothetical protein
MAVSLTCGLGQWSPFDQSMVNIRRAQTRPVGPGYGLGFACHMARAGAATSSYWATIVPWSTGAGEARFMVNTPALVHRP